MRFFRWQLGSRLLRAPLAMPFVNATRLLVRTGMSGATGNLYTGLHEVVEMAFLLHLLRSGEDFIDIGANIGSYSVLAAGVLGVRTLSVEPVPSTFESLLDNIHLNRLHARVEALNIGLSDKPGELVFSSSQDTTNHILSNNEQNPGDAIRLPVSTLNRVAGDYLPVLIKLDVEGFEYPVLQGGRDVLAAPSLLAAVVETNGSGRRYGYTDAMVDDLMREHGFTAIGYEPFLRRLDPLPVKQRCHGNTIYVRDLDEIQIRVRDAPQYYLGTGAAI